MTSLLVNFILKANTWVCKHNFNFPLSNFKIKLLASSGFDRKIFMWSVYGEECQNVSVMAGHKGAIMELHFSPSGENIYTCSTDKFLSVWSVETGQRIRKMKGHQNFVNSLGNARRGVDTLVSGSDDNTSKNLLNFN